MSCTPYFTGVGVSGSGNYPTIANGLYFTLPVGDAHHHSVVTSDPCVVNDTQVDQWVMNPDNGSLVVPGAPSGFTLFVDPQRADTIIGDGNTYYYVAATGYKRGSTGAAPSAYAPSRTALLITDFSVVNPQHGTKVLTITCVGRKLDGGGPLDQAEEGSVQTGTLTIDFAANATLTGGGGLDFNNLPTITVSASDCGTSGFTFSIGNGTLPAGLSLNASSGAITGSVTESGPYAFTVFADKVSAGSYCWGSVDYAGYVWVGDGGFTLDGRANGPVDINNIPQWRIHRIALKSRNEEKS